jgi:hypothetical protein
VNGRASIRFVHARDPDGKMYPDDHLDVDQLVPL